MFRLRKKFNNFFKHFISSFYFFTTMKIKKISNIIAFYKSTLPINLGISILPLILGGLDLFQSVFLTFGFFLSILIKELKYKNEYLFYHNNGISKTELLVLSYILNFLCLIVLVISINLIKNLF
jgi:hypothetical protein